MSVAAWTLLCVPFLAVVLRGGVSGVSAAILGSAVAALALFASLRPDLRAVPRDALVLVAAWSTLAILQIGWSGDVDTAIDGGAAVLAAAAVFLLAATTVRRAERKRWLVAFGLGGALVSLVALVATAPESRASYPLGNPNHLAGWLLLPLSIALAGICWCATARSHSWTILWFGVFGLAGAALAATGSRGALLAAGVALAALLLLRSSTRRGAMLIGSGFAVAILVLAIGPLVLPDAVPWARGGSEFSPGIRWMVYGAAMRTALDAAPLGTGIGGFEAAYAAHRPLLLHYSPRHAHSEPLHALVELGLPLLLLGLASAAIILRRVPKPRARRRSLAVWGSAAALLALAAHALVDSPLHVPAIALSAAALLGLAWPTRGPHGSMSATRIALAALGTALALVNATGFVAAGSEVRADALLTAGRFADAEREARVGLVARPLRSALWQRVANAAEHAHQLGGAGSAALARALEARGNAVAVSPGRVALYLERATLRSRLGDADGAIADLAEASHRDPLAPAPHIARARVLLLSHRPQAAAYALRDAIERHPLAAYSVVSDFVRATGDPGLARLAIPNLPGAIVGAGRALAVAGYSREAADVFERALNLDPTNARTALESARSWLDAGVADRAAAVLTRTIARVPDDGRLQVELERALARGRGGAS